MIYTSYFANWRKWPKGIQPVAIALYLPKYLPENTVKHETRLAPTGLLLRAYRQGTVTQEEYTRQYLKQINQYSPEIVGEALDNHLLLCYEKPGDFCHRNILADWLRDAGFEVQEVSSS